METIWNKIWSLKSLAVFKCESKTSLNALQYKRQSDSVILRKASLDTLFLCSVGQQTWLCF